jgi:FkbM family methyltransferase
MIEHLRNLLGLNKRDSRFSSSPATEEDVVRLFHLLLDHDPDQAARAYWGNLVRTKHIPISTIVDALLSSPEFRAARAARFEPTLVNCETFDIFVRSNDLFIGRAIEQTKQYEPYVAGQVRRILRPGHVFVDVGANIGYFTLLAAALVRPGGRVFAFEPNPDNCRLMRQSLAENAFDHVTLYEKAVAESAQQLSLSGGGADSNARLMRANELAGREGLFTQVEAVTLDNVLHDLERLDLLKIDIEGAEPRAWLGMQNVVRKHRPVLISEYAPDLIRVTSDVEPQSYLEKLWQEHAISIIERSGNVRPAQSVPEIVEAQAAAARAGVGHLDLIAFPR